MSELIIFAPIVMIGLALALSVSAFYGGFSFAYVRFLKKFKVLNDHIVNEANHTENIETLRLLNEFLISIKVENEKVKFTDWYKQSFFKDKL
jgi:hypothetical protein